MYRKFAADNIFNGHGILAGSAVLITTPDGTFIDIVDAADAGDGIEIFRGLLTPGFINAHCHLELSHLKGMIPQNCGVVDFVQQVMRIRASTREMKLEAMFEAEAAMYKNGIVAVGDICNTIDSIPVKQPSKLVWHNFIEVSGFADDTAQIRLDEMKKVSKKFQAGTTGQQTTFSPHAPYSVSKELFHLLNDETSTEIITIHNQECAAENELYQQRQGEFLELYKNLGIDYSAFSPIRRSSFQSWLPWFTNRQSIISVHNTFLSEDDLVFYLNQPDLSPLYYCLCVNANKYIEQRMPPIELLMKYRCNIIIGTDSFASNLHLDVFEEIKTIQQQADSVLPLQELLKWATINGARALKLDDRLGSFESGKKPGIVLIENLDNLQTTPLSYSTRIL